MNATRYICRMEYRSGIGPDTHVYETENTRLEETEFAIQAAMLALKAGTLVKIEIIEAEIVE